MIMASPERIAPVSGLDHEKYSKLATITVASAAWFRDRGQDVT
jgi:hypothetical protein